MKKLYKKLVPYGIVAEVLMIAEVIFAICAGLSFIMFIIGFFTPSSTEHFNVGPLNLVPHDGTLSWYYMLLLFGFWFASWKFVDTLYKFYRRVQEGEIFTDENVHAISVMSVASILVVVFLDVLNYITAKMMIHELKDTTLEVSYHISWVYLFMAVLIFVFASIFKKAVAAVKENEETI